MIKGLACLTSVGDKTEERSVVDRDLRDEVSDLEERIEELAESLQRCRKIILMSKISVITGGVLLFAIMLRLLNFDPLAMIVAVTAISAASSCSARQRLRRSKP